MTSGSDETMHIIDSEGRVEPVSGIQNIRGRIAELTPLARSDTARELRPVDPQFWQEAYKLMLEQDRLFYEAGVVNPDMCLPWARGAYALAYRALQEGTDIVNIRIVEHTWLEIDGRRPRHFWIEFQDSDNRWHLACGTFKQYPQFQEEPGQVVVFTLDNIPEPYRWLYVGSEDAENQFTYYTESHYDEATDLIGWPSVSISVDAQQRLQDTNIGYRGKIEAADRHLRACEEAVSPNYPASLLFRRLIQANLLASLMEVEPRLEKWRRRRTSATDREEVLHAFRRGVDNFTFGRKEDPPPFGHLKISDIYRGDSWLRHILTRVFRDFRALRSSWPSAAIWQYLDEFPQGEFIEKGRFPVTPIYTPDRLSLLERMPFGKRGSHKCIAFANLFATLAVVHKLVGEVYVIGTEDHARTLLIDRERGLVFVTDNYELHSAEEIQAGIAGRASLSRVALYPGKIISVDTINGSYNAYSGTSSIPLDQLGGVFAIYNDIYGTQYEIPGDTKDISSGDDAIKGVDDSFELWQYVYERSQQGGPSNVWDLALYAYRDIMHCRNPEAFIQAIINKSYATKELTAGITSTEEALQLIRDLDLRDSPLLETPFSEEARENNVVRMALPDEVILLREGSVLDRGGLLLLLFHIVEARKGNAQRKIPALILTKDEVDKLHAYVYYDRRYFDVSTLAEVKDFEGRRLLIVNEKNSTRIEIGPLSAASIADYEDEPYSHSETHSRLGHLLYRWGKRLPVALRIVYFPLVYFPVWVIAVLPHELGHVYKAGRLGWLGGKEQWKEIPTDIWRSSFTPHAPPAIDTRQEYKKTLQNIEHAGGRVNLALLFITSLPLLIYLIRNFYLDNPIPILLLGLGILISITELMFFLSELLPGGELAEKKIVDEEPLKGEFLRHTELWRAMRRLFQRIDSFIEEQIKGIHDSAVRVSALPPVQDALSVRGLTSDIDSMRYSFEGLEETEPGSVRSPASLTSANIFDKWRNGRLMRLGIAPVLETLAFWAFLLDRLVKMFASQSSSPVSWILAGLGVIAIVFILHLLADTIHNALNGRGVFEDMKLTPYAALFSAITGLTLIYIGLLFTLGPIVATLIVMIFHAGYNFFATKYELRTAEIITRGDSTVIDQKGLTKDELLLDIERHFSETGIFIDEYTKSTFFNESGFINAGRISWSNESYVYGLATFYKGFSS